MSGEEDEKDEKELELKDLIVQSLEASGLLPKLKAQLRASVFMALDENDKNSKTVDFQNHKVKNILTTNEGRLAAALIREFLEICNLDFTISVFDPELNSNVLLDKRYKLTKTLKLNENEMNKDNPVLVELLKSQQKIQTRNNSNENEISSNLIESIKSKFEKLDTNKKGILDKEKTKNLFSSILPNFNKDILEKFVVEELEKSDKIFKNGTDFDEFLSIYKKWYNLCLGVVNQNSSTESDDQLSSKFNLISSRANQPLSNKNGFDQFTKTNSRMTDSLEESSSSSSNSGFKRVEKPKSESNKNDANKTNGKSNTNDDLASSKQKKTTTFLDDNFDDFNFDPIKPAKPVASNSSNKNSLFDNDDFLNFGSKKTADESGSNTIKPASKSGLSSLSDLPPLNNSNNNNNNASQNKIFSFANSKDKKQKDEEENYEDDFTNNTTPGTPRVDRKSSKNRSGLGSDEEIEDNISYVEESSKVDEVTIDRSISTIQGNNDADYIEDVSI